MHVGVENLIQINKTTYIALYTCTSFDAILKPLIKTSTSASNKRTIYTFVYGLMHTYS